MAKYTVIVRELIARRGEIEIEAASAAEAHAVINGQIIYETIDMNMFDFDISPTIRVEIVDIKEG